MRFLSTLVPRVHPYSLAMAANWFERFIGPGLLLSFLLFLSGIIIPVASIDKLLFFTGSYSILAFIHILFEEGQYVLGTVIALFSVIFPFFKIIVALRLWWFVDHRSLQITSSLRRLETLGNGQ